MTIYKIRYTPETMRDMDVVWNDVYKASKDSNAANRYVNDFIDEIEKKRTFPLSGIPLVYRGLLLAFIRLISKSIKHSIAYLTTI